MKMNISIIGTGGVGGYFGGKLCELQKTNSDIRVSFFARGQHLAVIKQNGLLLKAGDTSTVCVPNIATDNLNEMPQPDIILLCVKSYSLNEVLAGLKDTVKTNTVILPLLNGIDIYERVRGVIKIGVVLPSCVYIGTHIESPGVIAQKGGSAVIMTGKDPLHPDTIDPFKNIFPSAGIDYKWLEDQYPEIWGKYIFIASFGMVTAAYNKTLGEVIASGELSALTRGIMSEIEAIAKAKGINMKPYIIEQAFKKASGFPPATKTSFQRDYEISNKPDERDLFGGTVIRLGMEYNIAAPVTANVYELINKGKSNF